jgi:hypothetical protein
VRDTWGRSHTADSHLGLHVAGLSRLESERLIGKETVKIEGVGLAEDDLILSVEEITKCSLPVG